MVEAGHVKGPMSLRNMVEKIFENLLLNLDMDQLEDTTFATIFVRGGSMTVQYNKGQTVLDLLSIAYDGAHCDTFCGIPVPEFIEKMEVLSESEWFSDGNNRFPLDDRGKKLLGALRTVAKKPEFRNELV